jgi:hypothetical protein
MHMTRNITIIRGAKPDRISTVAGQTVEEHDSFYELPGVAEKLPGLSLHMTAGMDYKRLLKDRGIVQDGASGLFRVPIAMLPKDCAAWAEGGAAICAIFTNNPLQPHELFLVGGPIADVTKTQDWINLDGAALDMS